MKASRALVTECTEMRETDEESSPNDTCPSFLFKIFVLTWTIKVIIDIVTTSLLFLCFGFVCLFCFVLAARHGES